MLVGFLYFPAPYPQDLINCERREERAGSVWNFSCPLDWEHCRNEWTQCKHAELAGEKTWTGML